MLTALLCYAQPLKNGVCTDSEYFFETTPFCHAYTNYTCHLKTWKFRTNSIYCKIFIYIHTNLFAPKVQDLLEKLAEILLYNFHQGRQSTGQYAYWPDQWSLLVLTGHYWWIGGQLVDWKNLVLVKILGIIYPPFYWNL